MDEEERRSPEHRFVHAVLRAAAAAALGEPDRCRRHVTEMLALRLATIDYLTITGLSVMIASGPMDRSATEATRAYLIQAAKDRDSKLSKAAEQNRIKQ